MWLEDGGHQRKQNSIPVPVDVAKLVDGFMEEGMESGGRQRYRDLLPGGKTVSRGGRS